VHRRDLAGRAAEGQGGYPEPYLQRFWEGYAVRRQRKTALLFEKRSKNFCHLSASRSDLIPSLAKVFWFFFFKKELLTSLAWEVFSHALARANCGGKFFPIE
jgi:hypothetical protein